MSLSCSCEKRLWDTKTWTAETNETQNNARAKDWRENQDCTIDVTILDT